MKRPLDILRLLAYKYAMKKTVKIYEELHRLVKARAATLDETVEDYVHRALLHFLDFRTIPAPKAKRHTKEKVKP